MANNLLQTDGEYARLSKSLGGKGLLDERTSDET